MDGKMPDNTESSAGDELAGGDQMGSSNMVTIPAGLMPGCKAGDTYTVKSMDGDNVNLEMTPGADDDEDWAAGAIDHVNKNGGQNG